ncbi:MAG: peptidoglycan-N-acetylglucosamine deacetylase [Microbacteriaceae bacterium]|nr:peptidoglycan-N-acetylglucosamine deacetylase [Microbacteriaceae bacterium]
MAGNHRLQAARAGLRSLTGGVAALLIGVGVLSVGAQPKVLPVERVRVNGNPVTVRAEWPVVADALRAAGMARADGRLLSAKSHKVLDPDADPARLTVDGRHGDENEPLRTGADILVHVGHDRVESLARRPLPVPGGGLPGVETSLWNAPKPGLAVVTYGERSGEAVALAVASPPAPASPDGGPSIALTFDDGPDPHVTPVLLDVLQALDVKATFCVIGYLAQRYPQIVQEIAQRGHTLCDHTVHHVEHLDRHPRPEQEAEIQGGYDIIKQITGQAPRFYRAPGGNLSPEIVDEAHARGMRVLGWNIDTRDYLPTPAAVLLLRTAASARPGAIILMHDGGGDGKNTVDMIQSLIGYLRAHGYVLRTP